MKNLNFTQILLIAAMAVIGYLIVFDKDPNPNAELEIKAEILQNELDSLDKVLLKEKRNAEKLGEKNRKWEVKDSLLSIELEDIKKENIIIRNKFNNASAERKKAEKMLNEFKKNGYRIDDPVKLIKDTKKRIGEND